jgi:hypothetical protein
MYRNIFLSCARFLGIPLDEVHNLLFPDNLIKYAAILGGGMSPYGSMAKLNTLTRFFILNDVKFDEMEIRVFKALDRKEPDDKPLTLETLQCMMNLGTTHSKGIIAVLASTGMRAGDDRNSYSQT